MTTLHSLSLLIFLFPSHTNFISKLKIRRESKKRVAENIFLWWPEIVQEKEKKKRKNRKIKEEINSKNNKLVYQYFNNKLVLSSQLSNWQYFLMTFQFLLVTSTKIDLTKLTIELICQYFYIFKNKKQCFIFQKLMSAKYIFSNRFKYLPLYLLNVNLSIWMIKLHKLIHVSCHAHMHLIFLLGSFMSKLYIVPLLELKYNILWN